MSNHSGIIDDGAKFQIVPNTRKITVPQSHKIIGTVGAHNSEQLTFQCPKLIDGHDVVNCSDHFVSWINAEGTEGRYDVDKESIVVNDENMYFPWVIDSRVTAAAGFIKFAVHFEDYDGDALLYEWGTTECNGCQILGTVKTKRSNEPTVVPGGYIKPSGTIVITENGIHPVSAYESANVSVPIPDAPSGTINIAENGEYNVSSFERAVVSVNKEGGDTIVTGDGVPIPVTSEDKFNAIVASPAENVGKIYSYSGFFFTIVEESEA